MAQEYVDWLNAKKDGAPYRLPTEAEWEFAARAGRDGAFATGAQISSQAANFNGSGKRDYLSEEGPYKRKTMPVGSYPPNAFGLYDLHGNAAEWVEDCYTNSHDYRDDAGAGPVTSGACSSRVMKGGDYTKVPSYVRIAVRDSHPPAYRDYRAGFRVARDLD